MNKVKPKNIVEYKDWLKNEFKIEISDRTRSHYQSVTNKIKNDFEKSVFWKGLLENLKKYDNEYLTKTGYNLLIANFMPELYIKSFDSFLLKTFRKNILENENWVSEQSEPKGGWILPKNWYFRTNDVIRTLFVVKYLDGVEFMISKIKTSCKQHSAGCEVFLEAREEGYYAAHLYTKQHFEVPRVDWDTEKIDISIEIQITTQLQEVIRRLLHKYYEYSRKKIKKEDDMKWQWNYNSDEFVANYLGHILHYVEGMIMEIRKKQKEEII